MLHYAFLRADERDRLFHLPPQPLGPDCPADLRSVALGATLYSPATRPNLALDLQRSRSGGVVSAVVCLEDSVPDDALEAAEDNLVAQLQQVHTSSADVPWLFVRVRTPVQLTDLVDRLGPAVRALSGFVLPKFTPATGPSFLDALRAASDTSGVSLMGMPVIESPEVIHLESRVRVLGELHDLLHARREQVLAVRLGATDFAGTYGLRRSADTTVYDVRLVANVIADVVNVMGRHDGTGFTITGPVWEYFVSGERVFKPQLRASVFAEHGATELRDQILLRDLDGLIREVELDKANGLTGKTVIHPTHVAAVHAMSVVSHEEYCDARDVLGPSSAGGVLTSGYRNKMNEVNPHRGWAQRVLLRAQAFGVARADVSFVDFLLAGAGARR
ncbi:MAG: HpcH/HpaI aldolase/citrate lyase family protein [Mycobacteriaceae bacterium]